MMDLPSDWCVATVAEIAEPLRYGYTASANPEADGPRMLRITDIQNGQVQWSCVPRCEIAPQRRDQYLLSPGDIVFARTGGTVGKSFLIREVPEPAVFASYLIKVASATGVEARYLYWFFQSLNYWGQIALRKGGLQGNVNAKTLGAIELPFAPTNEQRRIAMRIEALFDEIDRGVESLQDTKRAIGLYRQSLLKSAFEGRLTAQWRAENADKLESRDECYSRAERERNEWYRVAEDEWTHEVDVWRSAGAKGPKPRRPERSSPSVALMPEELAAMPEIPDEWMYLRLRDMAAVGSGMSVSKARKLKAPVDIPYLRVANVQRGFLDLGEVKTMKVEMSQVPSLLLRRCDVLFNEGGDRDKLGRGWVWECQIPQCITQNHVFRASPFRHDLDWSKYISWWSNSFGRDYFDTGGKQTTNLASINKAVLKDLPVPYCSPAEQAEIVRILDERFEAVDTLNAEVTANLARAEALRRSILKQAFSGKLVPQDPDDEPATVLLQRIRAKNASQEQKRRRPGARRR